MITKLILIIQKHLTRSNTSRSVRANSRTYIPWSGNKFIPRAAVSKGGETRIAPAPLRSLEIIRRPKGGKIRCNPSNNRQANYRNIFAPVNPSWSLSDPHSIAPLPAVT